jgi:uncharacterized protein YqeY
MSLMDKITADIKAAMLAKEKEKLEAIRAIKSALLLALTEKGASDTLSEDAEIKILQKQVKQRRESAEIYTQQNRPELAAKETFEADIIEKYLPKAMSEEELVSALQAIVAQVGAKAPSDMGKVMGVASKQLAGKADGKLISETVKKLLAQ